MHLRLLSTAAILALSLAACNQEEKVAQPYEVEEVPMHQIAADLAAGKTTAVAVTEAYIARIKMYDPPMKSVTTISPDAVQQAAASDARRKDGKSLGPLDGIPILFKDNIDAMGTPNTGGSFALENNFPEKDAEVVRRLRAAGAVILGKANTSQFAGWRATTNINGSTTGGVPRNPYDLTKSPAGSSSGSGASVAASFAAVTVGTCTTGSVIAPGNVNGVVSMRPTIALVSRRGIIPISANQDTSGPMGRNVRDVAMLLTVMAGSDPGDARSADADAHKADYAAGLSTDSLKGKRLGVIRGSRGYDAKTEPVFNAAVKVLTDQGAEVVEVPFDIFEDLTTEDHLTLTYDFKHDLNAYLATTPATVKVRTLTDLIAFGKADPRENMHGLDLWEKSEATDNLQNPEYVQALEYIRRKAGPEGFDRALNEYKVSALVMLTNGPAEVIPEAGSRGGLAAAPKGSRPASTTMYAAITGYPYLTVPMGHVDGMPVGLSFIGAPWTEQTLLSYGYAYEQASKMRVPPTAYKKAVAGN